MRFLRYLGLILALAQVAWAIGEREPLHHSAKKTNWDRKTNQVELIGDASVTQPGETLKADYIKLDLERRSLVAKGHCVYVANDSVIFGEEMIFNLETRTGTIIGGRVSAQQFTLVGERINKLGNGRFQTHWGEYTTCRDCPGSWSFQAEDVDMQFEGYAFMKNVTGKVLDAPVLWFPYLVFPLKTIRQSGFLFPRTQVSNTIGFGAVLPFFWAINRSSDMTFEAGVYTARGERLTWEGRYVLSEQSNGQANFYYLHDGVREASLDHRWALNVSQTQALPWGFTEKLRITHVSDNLYPFRFGDNTFDGNPYQTSTLLLDGRSPEVSGYVSASIYRNLLLTPKTGLTADQQNLYQNTAFDERTVQTFPSAQLTTNDWSLLDGRLGAGLALGVNHFWRLAGTFDDDPSGLADGSSLPSQYDPGVDPLRKAVRFSATPSIYGVFRPWEVLSFVPSLQYRHYFYTFGPLVPDLHRGYLTFQADLSTQVQKIIETGDPEVPRIRHVLRPSMTYSLIPFPYFNEKSSHPFLRQMERSRGYAFDSLDIVPRKSDATNEQYFVPLGHSLVYGLSFQRIRRVGALTAPTASYQKSVDFSVGQAIDFERPITEAFTRLLSTLDLNLGPFVSNSAYTLFTNRPFNLAHTFYTNLAWVVERSVRQGVMTFDRSISTSYGFNCDPANGTCSNNIVGSLTYSINDYVLPSLSVAYDLTQGRIMTAGVGVQFQSPSRCWKVGLNVSFDRNRISPTDQTGLNFMPDITLNLAGTGYGGVESFVGSFVGR